MKKIFKVSSIQFDFESVFGETQLSKKKLKDLTDSVINKLWKVGRVKGDMDPVEDCIDLTNLISDSTNWLIKDISFDQVEVTDDTPRGYKIIPRSKQTFLNMNMRLHYNGIDVGDEKMNETNKTLIGFFEVRKQYHITGDDKFNVSLLEYVYEQEQGVM